MCGASPGAGEGEDIHGLPLGGVQQLEASLSLSSCTFEDDCRGSDWLSIPDDFQQKIISHRVVEEKSDQVLLVQCLATPLSVIFTVNNSLHPFYFFRSSSSCKHTSV